MHHIWNGFENSLKVHIHLKNKIKDRIETSDRTISYCNIWLLGVFLFEFQRSQRVYAIFSLKKTDHYSRYIICSEQLFNLIKEKIGLFHLLHTLKWKIDSYFCTDHQFYLPRKDQKKSAWNQFWSVFLFLLPWNWKCWCEMHCALNLQIKSPLYDNLWT